MAKNVKEAVAEKIEIIDETAQETERKSFKLWILLPAAVAVVGAAGFVAVRRFLNKNEQ